MKRTAMVVLVMMLFGLIGATGVAAARTRHHPKTPTLDHVIMDVGRPHLHRPLKVVDGKVAMHDHGKVVLVGLVNNLLPCAAALTNVGLDVVGVYEGGPIVAWLSSAHFVYGMTESDANGACAAESFYAHIGHQKLCWNAHFRFWSDNGSAVFDNGLKTCLHTPADLDLLLCKYLPHGQWQDACNASLLRDYLLALIAGQNNSIGIL